MKIAVVGCAHGELETIYNTLEEVEMENSMKIDLLMCCGDFQSTRNGDDLMCMACPPKYRHICTFYKYFSGEKSVPVLTIFIGGNHEASNYLQELPYGGWVAPNIYYMGCAGIVNFGGLRIGGLSGLYKGQHFMKGHYEKPPYSDSDKYSVYHIRNLEIFRFKQVSQELDIFLAHEWPTGVYNFGNMQDLVKRKPYFKDEMERNVLGSKPCQELLEHLKPTYWFSAHLHCKFAALVPHPDGRTTKFLALDKCLPRRKFLQIIDVDNADIQLKYDLEWLTILHLTNKLLSVRNTYNFLPGPGGNERFNFQPTEEEMNVVLEKFDNDLNIPLNFQQTADNFNPNHRNNRQPNPKLNPQTVEFCGKLGIDDPLTLICNDLQLNTSAKLEKAAGVMENEDLKTFAMSPLKLPEPKLENSIQVLENENLNATAISPMKLPEPQLDNSKVEILIKEDSITVSPLRLSEPKGDTVIPDNNLEPSAVPVPEEGAIETPKVKTFKRRNAGIYNVEDP